MQWYYVVNGRQNGPVEEAALFALAREGKLSRDDLVWNSTMGSQWAAASTVSGLFPEQAGLGGNAGAGTPVATTNRSSAFSNVSPIPQPVTSTAAVWSLILGTLSMVCFGPLTGIPAIICGHVARGNIRAKPTLLQGSGMALSGLILGYSATLFTIVTIALFVFLGGFLANSVPSFTKARDELQKTVCINNLRQIDSAKEQWALATKQLNGSEVKMNEMRSYLPNERIPQCPAGGVYRVNTVGFNAECSIPGHVLNP